MAIRHGHSPLSGPSRTYRIWAGMLTRVRNPNHKGSVPYHKRHLDYDPRWDDFANFLSDMGKCPEGLSLDRIDNDKGYWPENCRWATRAMQSRNTSRNVWVILLGERLVIKDALRRLGYSEEAYHYLKKTHGFGAQQTVDRFAMKPKARVDGAVTPNG